MSSAASLAQQLQSKPLIERLLSYGTAVFAFIYGAGFLVVSIHHAQYGLPFFDFLRARCFAAGLLLTLLVTLPIVAASRTFSLFGLRLPVENKAVKKENVKLADICVMCGFSGVGFGLAYAVTPLFSWTYAFTKYPYWLIAVMAINGLGVLTYRRYINIHPVFTLLVNVIGLPISLFALWKAIDHEMFLVAMWFYLLGLCFIFLHSIFRMPDALRRTDIEKLGTLLLGVVLFFATSIYGKVNFAWGGGMLVPVTVHLIRPTAFSDSINVSAFLIDETDKGLYLTHKPEDKKASFIPREGIASVDYTPSTK
jgi:hypothetical protein